MDMEGLETIVSSTQYVLLEPSRSSPSDCLCWGSSPSSQFSVCIQLHLSHQIPECPRSSPRRTIMSDSSQLWQSDMSRNLTLSGLKFVSTSASMLQTRLIAELLRTTMTVSSTALDKSPTMWTYLPQLVAWFRYVQIHFLRGLHNLPEFQKGNEAKLHSQHFSSSAFSP